MKLGMRVKIVDDVGKEKSMLIGKTGTIVNFTWNKFRKECNLPEVALDDNQNVTVSGWGLWFEVVK